MQTSQPLSQQDLVVLNDLQYAKRTSAFAGMLFGPAFALAGTIMFCTIWENTSIPLRLTIAALLIVGFLIIRSTIKLYFKNREEHFTPAHGNMKQVYSGQLSHVEVIDNQYARYHFNGFSVDAWIPTGSGNPPRGFFYRRNIETLRTITNVPVTLSVALLRRGVNVLLDIHYDQQSLTESIQPLEVGDKKKAWSGERFSAGCFIFIAIIIAFFINAASRFSLNAFLFSLLFPTVPALLLILFLYATRGKKLKAGENKFVINTTLTEVMVAYVKSDDSTNWYHYVRLGNGMLVQISKNKNPCKAGDQVVLQYMQTRKGTKGTLIEIRKV